MLASAWLLCPSKYAHVDVSTGKGYIKQIPADVVEFSVWKMTMERTGLVNPEFVSGVFNLCIIVSTTFWWLMAEPARHPRNKSWGF